MDLHEKLFDACKRGDVAAVKNCIDCGANVNQQNSDGVTCLMIACKYDYPDIMHLLLDETDVNCDICDKRNRTALFFACRNSSSFEAVKKILDVAPFSISARTTKTHATVLHSCARRYVDDETTYKCMKLLLDAADAADPATINALDSQKNTPLTIACAFGCAPVVKLLIDHGADAQVTMRSGKNLLHVATMNQLHGEAIMTLLLLSVGLDYKATVKSGVSVLDSAYAYSGMMMRKVAKTVREIKGETIQNERLEFWPNRNASDPLGAMTEKTLYDNEPVKSFFDECVRKNASGSFPAAYVWAMMRHSGGLCFDDGPSSDCFRVLGKKNSVELWRLVADELGSLRHPITEDTLLHVAARVNSIDAVRVCMTRYVNPLLRNKTGDLPSDVTTEKEIREEIQRYSCWRPKRKVTIWYGPYFRSRARAFLLVCERWRRKGIRIVNKDEQNSILMRLAACEETFVRNLKK